MPPVNAHLCVFRFGAQLMMLLRSAAIVAALAAAHPAAGQTFTEAGQQILGTQDFDSRSCSFADIDNDGDPDLLFQGNGPSGNRDAARQLFLNNFVPSGELTFTNISATAGISAPDTTGWSAGWADVDGDGFVDVYLGQSNTGSSPAGDHFRNLGNLTFDNVSASTINDPGFVQNVAWADMNNDDLLDLLLCMEGPEMHELYLQQEAGSFLQLGATVGFHVPHGTKGYGMAVGDADQDGDLDVYMSTCRGGGNIRNNFFENRLIPDGVLFFQDIADTNGTQYMDNSYNAEFLDFDNDGWLDLFVIGADQFDSKIFRNNGDGSYTDVADIVGRPLIDFNGGDLNGGKALDYDNDGDLDLFFHDHLRATSSGGTDPSDVARLLYRNDGGWNFVNVTEEEGLLEPNRGAYDSAWADLDLDGDLDLVAPTASGTRERVYRSNASENGNHWLFLHLRSPQGQNTRAVGASVYATLRTGEDEEVVLRREANTNAGTFNQSDVPVHLGLGSAATVDTLRIVWPDGTEQMLRDVPAGQHLTMMQPAAGQEHWLVR